MKICMLSGILILYRFPQTMSLKATELKDKIKSLSDDMSTVTGYFNQLIEEFGEKKDDYTVDTFFGVLVTFYDAFMVELETLEKKKADAEEMKKKRKAQEELNKLQNKNAMDNFQKATKDLTSSQVISKAKRNTVRENRARQSMSPGMMTPLASRLSGEMRLSFRQSDVFSTHHNLGRESHFDPANNYRDSMLSGVSEAYSADDYDISSDDDFVTTDRSRRL